MKISNLIGESILKDNLFKLEFNGSKDTILKSFIKLGVLLSLGSILISNKYKKYALICISLFLALQVLLNFRPKKIETDVNNQKGNNLIGKDKELKESVNDEDFYDTIQLHHNDLMNKNIMDRNFYRLPNPRKLADQDRFAKWLYYQKDGCKINSAECFKHETLKNR